MATAQIRPDWTIGTLNLTAGVVEFTTTDSLLETAAIQAGDSLITESGLVLIIATITGQNAGTLMEPCPVGAAGIGQPLRIRFQPDGSRYNGAAADLVQLLGSGNVYEFAGLDGTGGGVPVFTGAGTMELGDYVADPNGNLGELAGLVDVDNLTDLAGLTLAARQILQTDENGVLKTIALAINKLLHTDANGDVAQSDITAFGLALIALSGTNGNIPVMTGAGTVASRPIVGTVSQSGGIPTGAIVERGSNSNGHYVRTAGGFQVCWTDNITFTGSGAGVRTGAWGFPADFSSRPVVLPPVPVNFADAFHGIGLTAEATTATAPSIAIEVTGAGAGAVEVKFLAFGVWHT